MQSVLDQKDLWHRDLMSGAMHYVVTLHYHYIEVVSELLSCSAVKSRSRSRHNEQEHVWAEANHVSTVLYTTVSCSRVLGERTATTASEGSRWILSNPPAAAAAVSATVIRHYLSLLRVSRRDERPAKDRCGGQRRMILGWLLGRIYVGRRTPPSRRKNSNDEFYRSRGGISKKKPKKKKNTGSNRFGPRGSECHSRPKHWISGRYPRAPALRSIRVYHFPHLTDLQLCRERLRERILWLEKTQPHGLSWATESASKWTR